MKAPQPASNINHDDQDVSQDPVWELLRQSPAVSVSPAFADRVLRAARQSEQLLQSQAASPFWVNHRVGAFAALTAMAAAIAIAAVMVFLPDPAGTVAQTGNDSVDAFATLDEVANQEMLSAATDHLGEFSDTELVSLIGF